MNTDEVQCSKCGQEALPEQLLEIQSEYNIYYYCISCLKEAQNTLSMKIYLNKDDRALLKKIRKFLKTTTN